jgi:hypothetical protein
MTAEEIKEQIEYNERQNKIAEARMASKRASVISEAVDKESYYNIMNNRGNEQILYTKFKQHVSDSLLAETMMCLVGSCMDCTIMESAYNKLVLRSLVTNYINENGGSGNILRKWRRSSYLLSELAYICEKHTKAICEKADAKNPASLKIKEDDKKKFFKDLDKANTDNVVSAIRTKVKNATAEFIDSNNIAKDQIKSILDSTKKKIEKTDDKKQSVKEAYASIGKKCITDIRNGKTKSVFEEMVYSISQSAFKNDDINKVFVENSSLNMDKIVEHCEVMYTFLETLNTCKIEKIDESYIEKLLKDLKS